MKRENGKNLYDLLKKLFPITRSITGNGNRKTLKIIKTVINKLKIIEYKSGKKVFDWKIPPEWNIKDAYVLYNKKKIIDYKKNNLHILGYSQPINKTVTRKELFEHIYTDKRDKTVIPYVTSYYKKNWGFCISENYKKKILGNKFKVVINSSFKKNGSLTIGELIIKGKTKKEILLSCNICHPSLANNELSGPTLLSYIGNFIQKKNRYYTYRLLFLPETIGAIAYLHENLSKLQKNFIAGFHLTCIGDDGDFSMVESKYANSYSDEIAKKVLKKTKHKIYSFLECGSDERQYNFPGINLPVVTLSRSKFDKFKAYHTSKDNLNFVSAKSLQASYNHIVNLINEFEKNYKDFQIFSTTKCEPFLTKRKLYRTVSQKNTLSNFEKRMFNILYFGDGKRISEISKIINVSNKTVLTVARKLEKFGIIKIK
jgi:aminopeptidase-like protein